MTSRLYIMTIFLGALACSSGDERVFKGDGETETKPDRTLLDEIATLKVGLDAEGAKPVRAATVVYKVTVTTNSGAVPCRGKAQVEIMTDFSLSFPKNSIQCASLTIDLAAALGAGGMSGGTDREMKDNISHDGKVLAMKTLANASFEPPRPFLIGPLIQNPDDYKDYEKTTEHKLTAIDKKTGQNLAATGRFTVRVLEHKRAFEAAGETFKNVIHWQLTSQGFDGIPAIYGLTFEHWEWYWNTRPVMIPKIVIKGLLSDFFANDPGQSGNSTTNALVGKITIELVAESYDM